MDGHAVTMLGTGLIGDFYTMTLHGQRSRDRVRVVYSRTAERGAAFSERWGIPEHTTDLAAAIDHPETDVVVVGLPNFLHEEAVGAGRGGRQGGAVHEAARPDGRRGPPDARDRSRRPASSAATSRTCATRPRRSRPSRRSRAGAIGDVTWVRSRETPSRPALGLVLGRPADRRRRDHRPRLPLHRDHPQLRRQGQPAGRGAVPHRHARPPDRRRGQRRSRSSGSSRARSASSR